MTLFECGFLAGGPGDQGKSNQIFNATLVPVRSTSTTLSVPFQGGWAFALAANADGDLYSWGVNHMTVRGKKSTSVEIEEGSDPNVPHLVTKNATAVGVGFDFAVVITPGGVLGLGPPFGSTEADKPLSLAPISVPQRVRCAAGGERHALLLDESGAVWMLGKHETFSAAGKPPNSLIEYTGALTFGEPCRVVNGNCTAVAAGARHSLVVQADGGLLAWGCNVHGQAGSGAEGGELAAPHLVEGLRGQKVVQAAGGGNHSLARTQDGKVFAWGANCEGQLGTGCKGSCAKCIAAGVKHSVALTSEGKVLAWGSGSFGQLGTGSYACACQPAEMRLPQGKRATGIVAGWWHSIVSVE